MVTYSRRDRDGPLSHELSVVLELFRVSVNVVQLEGYSVEDEEFLRLFKQVLIQYESVEREVRELPDVVSAAYLAECARLAFELRRIGVECQLYKGEEGQPVEQTVDGEVPSGCVDDQLEKEDPFEQFYREAVEAKQMGFLPEERVRSLMFS